MYDLSVVAQAIVSGVMIGFLFALVAVGLTLIYGMMDLVNFSHGEFVALGMYTAVFSSQFLGIDPIFTLPICAVTIGLLGVLSYKLIIYRLLDSPLAAQMFATFGLSVFLIGSMQAVFSAEHKSVNPGIMTGRIDVFGVLLTKPQAISGLIAVVCFFLLYLLLRKTEIGRALLATAQDRQAASLMGINTQNMYMVAWALAGGSAGVAGGLLVNTYSAHPTAGFSWAMAAYVAVVLGGFGSVRGALVGAVMAGLVQILSSIFITPQIKLIMLYSVFLLVLLIRPRGIMGVR